MDLSSKASGPPHLPLAGSHGGSPISMPFGVRGPGASDIHNLPVPPQPLLDLRKLLDGTAETDIANIFFGTDALAMKLQRIAYSCPPGMQPDLPHDSRGFPQARIQCNNEMMRRIRKDHTHGESTYVPYTIRQQAKHNIQKLFPHVPLNANSFNFNVFWTWMAKHNPYFYESEDNLAVMIKRVAASFADPGQTEVDVNESAEETAIIKSDKLHALAGTLQRGSATVTFTLAELRSFHPEKLHAAGKLRSLDWALDEKDIDDAVGAKTHARFHKYKVALEKLLVSGKGAGKGGKGKQSV